MCVYVVYENITSKSNQNYFAMNWLTQMQLQRFMNEAASLIP